MKAMLIQAAEQSQVEQTEISPFLEQSGGVLNEVPIVKQATKRKKKVKSTLTMQVAKSWYYLIGNTPT